MNVLLRNRITGETKFLKIGWSWTCFFFGSFLGIPLFLRGLYVWGALMAGIFAVDILLPLIVHNPDGDDLAVVEFLIWSLELGFSIYFGLKANALAGKRYLENGWAFSEPDSSLTVMARQKWGLPA